MTFCRDQQILMMFHQRVGILVVLGLLGFADLSSASQLTLQRAKRLMLDLQLVGLLST